MLCFSVTQIDGWISGLVFLHVMHIFCSLPLFLTLEQLVKLSEITFYGVISDPVLVFVKCWGNRFLCKYSVFHLFDLWQFIRKAWGLSCRNIYRFCISLRMCVCQECNIGIILLSSKYLSLISPSGIGRRTRLLTPRQHREFICRYDIQLWNN